MSDEFRPSPVLAFVENDGYTETAFLAAVRGIHPAVRLEYRPMLIEEQMGYSKAAAKQEYFELRREMAHWLAKKLVRWDVKDKAGEPVSPNKPSNQLRLKRVLFEKLFLTISGEREADADPDHLQTNDAASLDADDRLVEEARKKGCTVAELRERRDAGN